MMKKYIREFILRGLIFGGFGPIVLGIIYVIIQQTNKDFSLTGIEVCIAIISIYLLAFVQGGASVFNQIEQWHLSKSLLFHFLTLYIAYVACYLVNTWIPFEPLVLLIFTAIFVLGYFVIWVSVYIGVKITSKTLNSKIK